MNLPALISGCDDGYRRSVHYPFRRTDFAIPYLSVCASLALGEGLGFTAATACSLWPLMMAMTAFVILIGYGWAIVGWRYVAITLLGVTLAWCSESRRARVFDHCDYSAFPLTREFTVQGRVMVSDSHIAFDSAVDGVDVRILARRSDSTPVRMPRIGEIWHCSGWLERRPRNERRRRTLWVCGRGCFATCVSEAPASSIGSWLRRLRSVLSRNIGYGLLHDPLAADLDRAIILGERSNMPKETQQVFVNAGTVHVFAISGLHVGIIARVVAFLLMSVFCFPLRWVVIPLVPVLAGYVMMIDAPPSAVRAAVMAVVYFSAPMFFRRSDALVAWAITFVIFHVLNPMMLMKTGSLLSFAVMLGILLYVRWSEAFDSDWLVSGGATVAAWLSGVGIAARVFERVTFGGLVANVLMIPLASLAVVLGVVGAVFGSISPWLAAHFNNAAALVIEMMSGISWMTAGIPGANLKVEPWPMWMCFAWYVGLILAFWLVRTVYLRRRKTI